MARTSGVIGFGISEEIRPGVWEDSIVERKYRGELLQNYNYRFQTSDQVNDDISLSSKISIVADQYAFKNFHTMRYIEFMGAKWKITSVEPSYPKLILSVGGLYNGK